MERRGELQQLRPCEGRSLAWMTDSTASFRARYGVSSKEWEGCTAEWPASQRAKQYGLVEQVRKRSFNVDVSKVSAATQARYSRRRGEK